MIVSVFGASGKMGRAFVSAANEAGIVQRLHYRTAPEEASPELSTVIVGALTDPTAVREVMRGADAVVVMLGHRDKDARKYCAAATKAIIAGMRTQNVSRILCVTGAMFGPLPRNVSLDLKLKSYFLRRTGWEDVMDDRDDQERIVRKSKLQWTVVKPAQLSDGPLSINFESGPTLSVGALSGISRHSLARFLVKELVQPQYAETAVYVKGR